MIEFVLRLSNPMKTFFVLLLALATAPLATVLIEGVVVPAT